MANEKKNNKICLNCFFNIESDNNSNIVCGIHDALFSPSSWCECFESTQEVEDALIESFSDLSEDVLNEIIKYDNIIDSQENPDLN